MALRTGRSEHPKSSTEREEGHANQEGAREVEGVTRNGQDETFGAHIDA
jgi:hypothetical protein